MGSTRVKAKEEKHEEKKEKPKPAKPRLEKKEIKILVRVLNTDLDGEKSLIRTLKSIKGISHTMSRAICLVSGFDPNTKLGSLKEEDIHKIEEIIREPIKYGIPVFLVNRRKDIETGKDLHLSSVDMETGRRFDIQRMVDMKSYKGVRHMLGLPVRGQRTRSSFRKGRVVGVVRKSVKLALKKTEEEPKEKKK
ncbi:MAG TPA: 30S ribosomal protein S13 [archaeon]|nr:30S ribosomal protein S13 [archaeon]